MKLRIWILTLCLLAGLSEVFAQSITVKGNVVDENGEPLPGVSIIPKAAAKSGTVSSADGNFTISVKSGEKLTFSFIGYESQELVATAQMKVKMQPSDLMLNDVVVVGYMERKVANTSASVVKVSAKDLAMKPVANPLDAVQGKVSGLQVFSSSGEPSARLSMALHGQGSLGAGTGLLIILDGMQVSMAVLQSMNQNDIESVQFLKDAAATSIYGARAANGVMYVTTKRGKTDARPSITLRAQYAVSSLANTDYFDQLMTGPELLRYYKETGIYTEAEINNFKEKYFKETDFQWYKYIYQPAPMYTADVSVSGGTTGLRYYLSGGALSQDGLRMGSSYKKVFGRMNLDAKLAEWARANVNTQIAYDDTHVSPFGESNATGGGIAALNAPFASPYDPNTGLELERVPLLDISTPKHVIDTKPANTNAFILSTNGSLTLTPIKNLTLRSLVGLELNYGDSRSRVLPTFYRAYGNGSSQRSYSMASNVTVTNTAAYNMGFGDHHLTALLGHEYTNYKDDGFGAAGSGVLDERLYLLNNATQDKSINEDTNGYAFLSYFTQLSYDFSERYFIDWVLRNDASSRFGRNNRNGLFWSVGLLWKAKNEHFLKDLSWLNELDFKASYGTQGNSSIPPYSTTSYVGKVGQKKGGMSLGFISLGNPDLTWENQSKFTIGMKTRMFNRVDLNIEYYNRVTSDMLFEVPLPYSSGLPVGSAGYATRYENAGRYLNHGIDLQLNADLLRGRDWGVSANVNFNYNRDKVLELFEGRQSWLEPGGQLAYIVGKPVTFMLPLYKGVNVNTGVPEWYKPGSDINESRRDDNDVVSEYTASLTQNTGIDAYTPVTGGWGISAYWKGFYVNADFFFALGKHMISLDKQFYENDFHVRNRNANFNGSRRLFDYWKQPGDNAEYPSLEWVRDPNHHSNYVDSKMLEDASFMRLKNFTIGYDIPRKSLGKQTVIRSVKVFFTGRNLLTFTKFRGIDPEVNRNISHGVNPNTKQMSVGVEIGL